MALLQVNKGLITNDNATINALTSYFKTMLLIEFGDDDVLTYRVQRYDVPEFDVLLDLQIERQPDGSGKVIKCEWK